MVGIISVYPTLISVGIISVHPTLRRVMAGWKLEQCVAESHQKSWHYQQLTHAKYMTLPRLKFDDKDCDGGCQEDWSNRQNDADRAVVGGRSKGALW